MSNPAKFPYPLVALVLLCAVAASAALAQPKSAAQTLRQSWQSETIYLPTPCIDEFDIEQIEQDEDDLPLCPPL